MPAPCHAPVYPELAAEIARRGRPHADLAAAAGCVTTTISQIIRGHVHPSEALRQRIADALGRDVNELFVLSEHVQRLVDLAEEQGLDARLADPSAVRRVAVLTRGSRSHAGAA